MRINWHCNLLFFSLLLILTDAGHPSKTKKYDSVSQKTLKSCVSAVYEFEFGTSFKEKYPKICSYPPTLGSVLLCGTIKMRPHSKEYDKLVKSTMENCMDFGNVTLSENDIYMILENSTENAFQLELNTNYTGTTFYQAINITEDLIAKSYKYYSYSYFNLDKTSILAGMMYLYFLLVFLLFAITNFFKRIGIHRSFDNKAIRWFRANVSTPALFNGNHTNSPAYYKFFSTLFPTRAEGIVVLIFVVLNIIFITIHYELNGGNKSREFTLMKSLADRSGILAFSIIPLLIIFAGRNNIIISITGIPYTSLIFYHKWVARMMWINALIHSSCYTAYAVRKSIYTSKFLPENFVRWGVVATTAGGVILFQAFHCFRSMSYDTFLVLHILLAVFFVVGCWYHCYNLGYLEWIYSAWALWGFDRIIRIIRMGLFGIKEADIKYLGDDTFRVKVPYNISFNPFPGAYAFVYFMTSTHFWQSHPFTVIKSYNEEKKLIIFIKAKKGITKLIRKKLDSLHSGSMTMKICIEGAYGHRCPTEKYDKVLLMAGGNGIPGLYAHAMDLAKRNIKQEIKLTWTVRNLESLCWFQEELDHLTKTNVQVDIYVTRQQAAVEGHELGDNNFFKKSAEEKFSSSEEISKLRGVTKRDDGRFNFHFTRPNVDSYIKEEFQSDGTVCVVTCGPPKMCDDIRKSFATHLMGSNGRVDLFEELQVW